MIVTGKRVRFAPLVAILALTGLGAAPPAPVPAWQKTDARWAALDARWRAGADAGEKTAEAELRAALAVVTGLRSARRPAAAAPMAAAAVAEGWRKLRGDRHPEYATALNNLAIMLSEAGRHDEAVAAGTRAAELRRQLLGDLHPEYARAVNNLGVELRSRGQHARALEKHEEAAEAFRRLFGDDDPEYAGALNERGYCHTMRGEYGRALPPLEKAYAIKDRRLPPDHPDRILALQNLAVIHVALGQRERGLTLARQQVALSRRIHGRESAEHVTALKTAAAIHAELGDVAEALRHMDEALALIAGQSGEDSVAYAKAQLSRAALLQLEGKPGEVRQLLMTARQTLGKHKSPGVIDAIAALAARDEEEGHPLRALDARRRVLKYQQTVGGSALATADRVKDLAGVLSRMGQHDEALKLFKDVLTASDRHLDDCFADLSDEMRLSLLGRHRFHLDAYLSAAVPAKAPAGPRYDAVLAWKGRVAARSRDDLTVRGRPELRGLLDDLELARTRLSRRATAGPGPEGPAKWEEALTALRADRARLEGELARKSEAFRGALPASPVRLADVKAAVPDGVALVDYLEYTQFTAPPRGEWRRERRLVAFVVRGGAAAVYVPLGPAAPVTAAVRAWRGEVEARRHRADPAMLEAAAAELHKRVWAPLARHIGDAPTVLIAPDGALCEFPFAALPGSGPGTYLLEEKQLGYVGGGRHLVALLAGRQTPARGLVAVGGVSYAGAHEALPGTGPESERCRELFRGRFPEEPATVLTGGAATPTALVSATRGGCRLLHLATHGRFDPSPAPQQSRPGRESTPLAGLPLVRSGLVLAGEGGGLTAEEVASLDLRGCELVTLSACQTALGDVKEGEGVLGLARAFQQAGAASVTASLWSVNDAATAVLMEEFYANLWVKKLSRLEALRQAQLTVLRDPDRVTRRAATLVASARERGLPADDLRGPKGRLATDLPAPAVAPAPGAKPRAPAAWWAAFVLSGDWRPVAPAGK